MLREGGRQPPENLRRFSAGSMSRKVSNVFGESLDHLEKVVLFLGNGFESAFFVKSYGGVMFVVVGVDSYVVYTFGFCDFFDVILICLPIPLRCLSFLTAMRSSCFMILLP